MVEKSTLLPNTQSEVEAVLSCISSIVNKDVIRNLLWYVVGNSFQEMACVVHLHVSGIEVCSTKCVFSETTNPKY